MEEMSLKKREKERRDVKESGYWYGVVEKGVRVGVPRY